MAELLYKRFELEQVLEVLLRAREGNLDKNIPIRTSASPIHPLYNCFYVQPTETRKLRFSNDEMRVKYNNVVRSKVWWSEKHGKKIGLVSRAMSMKTRSEKEVSSNSFQHGFQGHWVSLLIRDTAQKEPNKAVVRKYVQEDVPGLVQFWSAISNMKKSKKEGRLSRQLISAGSDSESSDYYYSSTPRGRSSELSNDTLPSDEMSFADMQLPAVTQSSQTRIVLRNGKRGPPVDQNNKDETGGQPPRVMRRVLRSGSTRNQVDVDRKVNSNDIDMALECILEEKEDDSRHESKTVGDKDTSVIMYEIFQKACDVLDPEEFPVFYERHCGKLFNADMALEIKRCLENNDPRLSADFIFPDESVGLVPHKTVASGIFKGSYVDGFELIHGSKELAQLVGGESVKNVRLYETILDSKIQDMFTHLCYKKRYPTHTLPGSYLYQTIARVRGCRIVLRCFCTIDPVSMTMEVKMQDVSDLYPDILALPPLPY